MTIKSQTGCMIIAPPALRAEPALAQTTPPQHVLQKTIGQAGPDIVPSLIVINARGASRLQGGKLTLTGVAPNSIAAAASAAYPYCGYYPYPPCY